MLLFDMNGYLWKVIEVSPSNPKLIDRTGVRSVATTEPATQSIYISSDISGLFKIRVLTHELGHAAMFSYYLVDDIHRMTRPEYRLDAEEWICNFVADYGWKIFQVFKQLNM